MKVDASTRRKLKLASAILAKGTSKPAGEGFNIKMVATAAVRKKLKAVKTVKVTYSVTATSPISEMFKQTVVMKRQGHAEAVAHSLVGRHVRLRWARVTRQPSRSSRTQGPSVRVA